jgi:hypothetical protein
MDEERRKNLRLIREGTNWDEIEALEVKLLREETPQEGIKGFLSLMSEFAPMLEQTAAIFQPERDEAVIALQERLHQFGERSAYSVEELLKALVSLQERLESANVPSALIGGLAVGAWGDPRLTRDIDLKILLRRDEGKRLLSLLGDDYRSLHADPESALRQNGIVFVLSPEGKRIDIALSDTSFDEELIARAQRVEILPNLKVRVCSAEDLIVLKIIAIRPKDQQDVVTIIQRQGNKLDDKYILKWLKDFEKAIDDSTLVDTYQRLKKRYHRD